MNIQRWCQYFFEVSCLQIQELGFLSIKKASLHYYKLALVSEFILNNSRESHKCHC